MIRDARLGACRLGRRHPDPTEGAEAIKIATDGRVHVQVFQASPLGGVAELVDGVRMGSISLGHHDFASLARIVPGCGRLQRALRLSAFVRIVGTLWLAALVAFIRSRRQSAFKPLAPA